jgi:hypothetical protein
MYWNYFYNIWKTVSSSPFSNAIVFVSDTEDIELPSTIKFTVGDKSVTDTTTILTLDMQETVALNGGNVLFVQTQEATEKLVAIHKYGAIIIPNDSGAELTLEIEVGDTKYTSATKVNIDTDVEAEIVFNKQ